MGKPGKLETNQKNYVNILEQSGILEKKQNLGKTEVQPKKLEENIALRPYIKYCMDNQAINEVLATVHQKVCLTVFPLFKASPYFS